MVYLGCIISPPSLMDDVDAVMAQVSRNMLTSGDWVTARLDGVPYLEKAPLLYWTVAISMKVFGAHDWAARIPIALSVIALCWITAIFGAWHSAGVLDSWLAFAFDLRWALPLHPHPFAGRDAHSHHRPGFVGLSSGDR